MTVFKDIINTLDLDSQMPLYRQLRRSLPEAVDNHVWGQDNPLPIERDMAAELEFSRITVRKTIESLVTGGLLMYR